MGSVPTEDRGPRLLGDLSFPMHPKMNYLVTHHQLMELNNIPHEDRFRCKEMNNQNG